MESAIWAGYARISEDPSDARRGVKRQQQDIRDAVARKGGDPDKIVWFIENDTSAYKKRSVQVSDPTDPERKYTAWRVVRPVWNDVKHALREQQVDRLMVWDLDRLARDPRDLEDAIELVQARGCTIVSATSEASTDLTTDTGVFNARIMVGIANKSSADTARRVRRAHLENAQTGKPVGGRRPFGWQDDKTTIHEEEAALIRKAADDIIAGVPLRQIAREWTELGVKTPSGPNSPGRDWSGTTISRMLRSPRLAGWRIHQRQIAIGRDGQPVRGQWEPILEQAKHDALVKALTRPERRSRIPRKGARHYLLTGIVRCGVCNGTMFGNRYDEGKHYYVCQGREGVRDHGLSISGHGTDAAITELVLARLADIDLDRPVPVFAGEQRLGQIEQQIGELMGAFSSGTLSAAVVFPQVSALEAERDELQAQRADLEAAAAGPKVGHVDRATWEAMDVHRRRAVIERVLDAVLIKPPTRRLGNRLDLDRIVPVWRTAE